MKQHGKQAAQQQLVHEECGATATTSPQHLMQQQQWYGEPQLTLYGTPDTAEQVRVARDVSQWCEAAPLRAAAWSALLSK